MKHLLSIVCTVFTFQLLSAQDPTPTLFDTQPLLINPAMTGEILGDYTLQFSTQDRRQWFDALNKEHYNFTAAAVESFLPICFGTATGINYSPGLSVLTTRLIGDVSRPKLERTKLAFHNAFQIQLSSDLYAAVGVEFQGIQHNLNSASALQFGTQFDGMGGFDTNASSQEMAIGNADNLNTGIQFDLATGTSFLFVNDRINARLGIAVHHLRRPVLSFFGNSEDDDARLSRRYTFHYRAKTILARRPNRSTKYSAQLFGTYWSQGIGIWQANQGIAIDFYPEDTYFSISGGVQLTNNEFSSGSPWTSTYSSINVSRDKFTIRLTMDFAYSPFVELATDNTATALELGLAYRFLKKKKKDNYNRCDCPSPNSFFSKKKNPIGSRMYW
jgi:hypothetical protein